MFTNGWKFTQKTCFAYSSSVSIKYSTGHLSHRFNKQSTRHGNQITKSPSHLKYGTRGRNPSNISVINCRPRREEHEFGRNILLANTQSLASKIDELQSVMLNVKPDLGFFTETWLHETISDSQVNIPGYSFIARNRCVDIHGGVGLYIHDSINEF